jgi:amino acid adenylation domain-containing protein
MDDPHGLHSRFLRGLAKSPDGVAVRAGRETITYRRMHEQALLWGGALARSASPAVGVLATKGITAYTGILATLYAGATVVPLRPDFPAARTRQMLDASGATAIVVDHKGQSLLAEVLGDRDDFTVLSPETVVPERHTLDEPAQVKPGDTAYILFTSGSTGRPKGVVLGHGGMDHYFRLQDARYDFTPDDVFSQAFDLNFDCSVFDMFCAWGAGATVVPIPAQAYRELPEFIAEQRMTVWFSTPSVIDLIRRMDGLADDAMPGLRWSFFAGEALKCHDVTDWLRAASGSTLENLYGPTELTITVAAHRWSDEHSQANAINGVAPIGAVHDDHDYLLLNDEGEPTDTEGELAVAGPQLAAGYLDPGDEQGRFFERDGQRWYRTGDRVRRLDDGELGYLGRRDSQIQVQGWRVEPAEVEHAMRECGVADAVVVGVNAGGSTELVAFYTGDRMATVELVRRLRKLLPDGVLPKRYHHMTEFPLNTNRKVDRLRLTAQAAEHGQARGVAAQPARDSLPA